MDIITVFVIFAIVLVLSLILRIFFAVTKVVIMVILIALLLGFFANWQKDNIENIKNKYEVKFEQFKSR